MMIDYSSIGLHPFVYISGDVGRRRNGGPLRARADLELKRHPQQDLVAQAAESSRFAPFPLEFCSKPPPRFRLRRTTKRAACSGRRQRGRQRHGAGRKRTRAAPRARAAAPCTLPARLGPAVWRACDIRAPRARLEAFRAIARKMGAELAARVAHTFLYFCCFSLAILRCRAS